jgi:hypothetical protein
VSALPDPCLSSYIAVTLPKQLSPQATDRYYTLGENRQLVLVHPSSTLLPIRHAEAEASDEEGATWGGAVIDVDKLPTHVRPAVNAGLYPASRVCREYC